MRKHLQDLILATLLMVAVLTISQWVAAQSVFSGLEAVGKQTGLPTQMTPHGTSATSDLGINQLEALVLTITDLIKYIVYGISIFVAFWQGFKLVIAGKDIDTYLDEAKKNTKYALMAMLIVFLADTIVRKVIFPDQGAVFDTLCAQRTPNGPVDCSSTNVALYGLEGLKQIRGIYNAMAYGTGSLAILVIIISGVGIALSTGDEEKMKKHRNRILWSLAGLLIVGIAEFVVRDVVFPEQGTQLPNISKGLLLVKKFTNFMSGFISTISFGILLYAGYLYVTGATNEENINKAKKAITAAIVGILISLAAFGLVSTFIKVEGRPAVAPLGQAPAQLQFPAK